MAQEVKRCQWAYVSEKMTRYHDEEWGRPVHDDRKLFEMLVLEGMQAGLSWELILRKREAYLEAFDGLNPEIVKDYDQSKVEELLQNPGIIRNRLKVHSIITNARLSRELVKESGSLDTYFWGFVDRKPVVGHWETMEQVPATTELSDRISKDLKKRGFKFVGSTIIYSFLQATGIVIDHIVGCFCYQNQ